MPKETLCLDSIGNVDAGALRVAVNNALKLLTQDLADRPSLDKPRKLLLEICLKPIVDKNSHSPTLESADVSWQVLTKAPAIGSSGTTMKPAQNGQLYFHSDIPDSPDDETIMDEAERRRLERQQKERQSGGEGK